MTVSSAPRTDPAVQKTVQDELNWDPAIDADDIGVAVDQGVVTLSGTVDTYAQKLVAERAVRPLRGVRAVANEIAVRRSDTVTDKDIAESAVRIIETNPLLADEDLEVSVRSGIVTLAGKVRWEYQRQSALYSVEQLEGVLAVTNMITVQTPVQASIDVHQAIREAFKRNASIDASRLKVTCDHGHVVLDGSVDTLADRMAAEQAAWCAPGVTQVLNNIVVR